MSTSDCTVSVTSLRQIDGDAHTEVGACASERTQRRQVHPVLHKLVTLTPTLGVSTVAFFDLVTAGRCYCKETVRGTIAATRWVDP